MRTGFVGTPYLLHVLSDYGHSGLVWKLLLRKAYPGWLFSVCHGATTRVVQNKMTILKETGRIERIGGKRYGRWEIRK